MNTTNPEFLNNLIYGFGSALPVRILFCLVGGLILVLLGRNGWRKQVTVVSAVLWALLGISMFAFGVNPEGISQSIISIDHFARVRIVIGGISVLVLAITFESIRRTHLQERYAFLWLATGAFILLCVIFPKLVDLLRGVMGMEFSVAVAAMVFFFLMLVSFHFSIAFSKVEDNQSRSAQEHAVLETRVRELEKRLEDLSGESEPPSSKS
jgi:hypothetical protein